MTEQKFVYIDVDYLKELEETAKKVDYYKGVIDGMNLAIDRKDEPRKEQNFCDKCRYLYRDFKYGLSCYRLMDNEPCEYEERKDEPQTEENEIPEYEPWRDAFDGMDCCSREVQNDNGNDVD